MQKDTEKTLDKYKNLIKSKEVEEIS